MMTLDTVAIIVSIIGLIGLVTAFLSFVSNRPTRSEMNTAISASVDVVREDIRGLRDDIKELWRSNDTK